jgi:hypothetical protein
MIGCRIPKDLGMGALPLGIERKSQQKINAKKIKP